MYGLSPSDVLEAALETFNAEYDCCTGVMLVYKKLTGVDLFNGHTTAKELMPLIKQHRSLDKAIDAYLKPFGFVDAPADTGQIAFFNGHCSICITPELFASVGNLGCTFDRNPINVRSWSQCLKQ